MPTPSVAVFDVQIAVYGTRFSGEKLPCAEVKEELSALLKGKRLRIVSVKLKEVRLPKA